MNQGDRAVCVVGHGRTQIPGPAAGAQKGISFSGKRTGSLAIAGEPLEVGPPVRPERSRVQLPHPAEAEFSEAIERFRILQGRPSLPSVEIRLRHEPELFVNFPSVRGRVEFDAPDAGTKIVDAVMQQAGGATQAAEVGVHQDHGPSSSPCPRVARRVSAESTHRVRRREAAPSRGGSDSSQPATGLPGQSRDRSAEEDEPSWCFHDSSQDWSRRVRLFRRHAVSRRGEPARARPDERFRARIQSSSRSNESASETGTMRVPEAERNSLAQR